ncbi:hypothetical protein LP420_38800 [Massilia sp. B-10]|nr:hypothetical protein LP420_38800 [Massilia sp. B-10]
MAQRSEGAALTLACALRGLAAFACLAAFGMPLPDAAFIAVILMAASPIIYGSMVADANASGIATFASANMVGLGCVLVLLAMAPSLAWLKAAVARPDMVHELGNQLGRLALGAVLAVLCYALYAIATRVSRCGAPAPAHAAGGAADGPGPVLGERRQRPAVAAADGTVPAQRRTARQCVPGPVEDGPGHRLSDAVHGLGRPGAAGANDGAADAGAGPAPAAAAHGGDPPGARPERRVGRAKRARWPCRPAPWSVSARSWSTTRWPSTPAWGLGPPS